MSRHDESDKKAVMADVEPGSQTGVYHMPICNLPFGTSWQDFKDWLKASCEVEHVELFQSSTSGWIRLRGEENFEKAWKRLKNDHFRNRAIIASDRNRNEAIKIKELVDTRVAQYGATSPREMDASLPQSPQPTIPPMLPGSVPEFVQAHHAGQGDMKWGHSRLPSSLSSPTLSSEALAHGNSPLSQYRSPADIWPPMASPLQPSVLPYNPAFGYYEPTPSRMSAPSLAYYQSYLEGHHPVSPHSHSVSYSSSSSTPNYTVAAHPAPPSQPCQVVVQSIQHRARPSEVSDWICHQLGEHAPAITAIEVPQAETRGRIKGTAYINLTNAVTGEAAVRILNQKLFRGRVVSCKLIAAPATGWGRPRDSRQRASRHSIEEESAAKHGKTPSEKKEGKSAGTGPVIVDGSSTRKQDKKK